MIKQLKETDTGSQTYKGLEAQIAKRRADLQVQMQLQQKEFLQKEAKIYHDTYKALQSEVQYFAGQNSIDLVLWFNGEPVDPDQPRSILQEINKPVVYYAPDLDITKIISDRLNQRAGVATRPQSGASRRPGVRPPNYKW
jgi:Skp family chaperone for outer membrane proteins